MTTDVQEVQQAYVRYGRKISPKEYESAEASLSIPVALPDSGVTPEFLKDVEKAFNEAVLNVSAVLGLSVEVADDGSVTEKAAETAVAAAFLGPQRAVTPAASTTAGAADKQSCPKCGSEMWDNRNDKRSPKSPDWKCKNKSCGHPIWINEKF